MEHLDDAALRALEGKDARAVAYFREHLSRSCPECEAFLANAPEQLWWLEAEADRLLHIHGAVTSLQQDTAGFHAVRRAMRARRMRKALAASLAAAAAVLAGIWLTAGALRPAGPSPEWDGIKGQESGLLELSAAAVSRDGAVRPVAPGGRARSSDTLVLRYRADRDGTAFLIRSTPGGGPVPLGQVALSAGTHDLADSGGTVGLPLDGERG